MTVEARIKMYKERLIHRAGLRGLWENFGQKEVRILQTIYLDHQYLRDGVWDKIMAFDNWCMDYTGE